ncbi:MAG: hypothetical protein HY331_11585 [Chloroflexi bacterium]|nr:hypothetical protein [Chloroflexota bacterium]
MQTLILAHDPGRPVAGRWYRPIVAGKTPISLSDVVELRAAVDTLRVAAGLEPVTWEGSSAEDRTFRAGQTPIRARHFTQLREAIADLWRIAENGPLPEFTGGPIVPGTRLIRVTDPLDLRGWVEQYEAAVPERAARAVQLYDEYTAGYPELVLSPLPKANGGPGARRRRPRLTEEWDTAGFSRYGYDAQGRLTWRLRFVDDRAYAVRYAYDDAGLLRSIVYPVADRESEDAPMATYQYTDQGRLLDVETSLGLRYPASLRLRPSAGDWVDDLLKLTTPTPSLSGGGRVVRDLHGFPVKVVEGLASRVWVDGALPVGDGAADVSARPIASLAWSAGASSVGNVAYSVWSGFDRAAKLIGAFSLPAPTRGG